MKKKLVVGTCIAVSVALVGGTGLWFSQQNAQAQEESRLEAQKETQIKKDLATVAAIQADINLLYKDEKKEFLAAGASLKEIDAIQAELKKLEGRSFDAKVGEKINTAVMDTGYAQNMILLEKSANSLLDSKGVLTVNADVEVAKKRAAELKNFKPAFTALQEQKINNAVNQKTAIQTATNKVNALFTTSAKTTVKPGVSEAAYTETKKLVDAIKQTEAKKTLQVQLNKVNQYLLNQEQKQVAKQENQQQVATEKAPEGNTSDSSNQQESYTGNSSSSSSSNNNTSSSTNESAPKKSVSSSSGSTDSSSSKSSSAASSQPKSKAPSSQAPSKSDSNNKASSGSNKGNSGQTTPPKNNNNSNSSSKKDEPGKTYEGSKENQGSMDSDGGREWGTINW
ncbi:hypothetical protein HCJ39_06990 [Listeria rocourtiae]|uniref:toxin Cry1Ac domain D-VI-related protein n=1 Tax=Listeria rocourtiae TaxID=647910 RepID=UPI00162840D9|nr:toxin Cry1Ac domain D-VI-related protein [Listeria rocourtiae]MBC1604455.1 hypothetical protein [Listeria rocourtiae]